VKSLVIAGPFLTGLSLIFLGIGLTRTECSNRPPGGFDIVCRGFYPFAWLFFLGLGVLALWSVGVVWYETKPHVKLAGYWRQRLSPASRIAVVVTAISFGFLASLFNWVWSGATLDIENYWYWFLMGSVAGFLVSLAFYWTLREIRQIPQSRN